MNRPEVSLHDQITALLPRLRRFARTIARHSADADDLVQLTVERALVRLDQWRADTRLESWMFTIMKNAWIDEVRARVRRARVLAPEEAGENVGDSSAEAQVTAMSVEAAMARLPEDQRIAVGLVLVEVLLCRSTPRAFAQSVLSDGLTFSGGVLLFVWAPLRSVLAREAYSSSLLLTAGILVLFPPARGLSPTLERALAFGCASALLWELGEYAAFIRHSPELQTAYTDTLGDLTLGTLGSLVAGVVLWRIRRDEPSRESVSAEQQR